MRKKGIEEKYELLKERFDVLSRNYDKLADIVNNDHRVLEFIANHDRIEVVINDKNTPFVTFMWGMQIFGVVLPHDASNKCVYSVFYNSPTSCIIMADNFICPTYYKLDKTTQSFVDVTEFYKRAELERSAKVCDELKLQKCQTEEKCEGKCKKGDKK